jgi:hypothetical protein
MHLVSWKIRGGQAKSLNPEAATAGLLLVVLAVCRWNFEAFALLGRNVGGARQARRLQSEVNGAGIE